MSSNSISKDTLVFENRTAANDNYQTMEQFLRYIDRRAFHFVRASVGNIEDTHDIVQESMYKLVQKYADKPTVDWKPLLYKIMSSKIADFHRRRAVREKILFQAPAHPDQDEDYLQTQVLAGVALDSDTPLPSLESERRIDHLTETVKSLPVRQQQAFMLRCWEGLSTRDTAIAMSCSEGSVKTHYS
ncbi:RNA polymerase sigma factor, partial [Porticoccaceae bacterium]|nr:RNA polymerase sigma factor [Porticoccaceae bacterium]